MPIIDRKSTRYKAIERIARQGGLNETITTGIHGREGGAEHEGGTVSEIAEINEFGLGVPQRSFVRAWFDENLDKFPKAIRAELEAALKAGKPKQAFKSLAVTIQASIQQRISNGIEPENADSTILQKGSSTPLIDEGILRSAILTKVGEEG